MMSPAQSAAEQQSHVNNSPSHVIIGHMAQEVTTTIETREHTESRVCIVGGHMSQACESP